MLQDDRRLECKITRHARGDVAEVLKLPSGDMLGFCAISEPTKRTVAPEVSLHIPSEAPYKTGPLAETGTLSASHEALVPEMLEGKIGAVRGAPMGSDAWWTALAELPEAHQRPQGFHGFVEGILVSPIGNGLVHGWALHPDDAHIWLEDEMQNVYPLRLAFRRERRDISIAFKNTLWADIESQFIAHFPEVSNNPTIKLRAVTELGLVTISECSGAEFLPYDPRGAAERIFDIESEDRDYHRRAPLIDWPIIKPLIARYRADTVKLTPQVSMFGPPPKTPEVSVIVPLYKRFDFIEHQVIEFIRDPFFRDKVELIYVIDDPEIRLSVLAEAEKLFRLYEMPMRVVSGIRNRGFSGANNLGAIHANGEYLLFLNSDVIPIAPGWLEQMLGAFGAENVGAVGAQLLFPNGGIQHVGMNFEYLADLQIWSNQHTGTGMPAYSADRLAFDVPAVTGACVLIPRDIFTQIGGWDTGYLLGDFEDSHLCFAIRDAGFRILCQPASILTHLERQSFTGIGGDAFRIRMTICNAVRHQGIWQRFLELTPPSHSEQDAAP